MRLRDDDNGGTTAAHVAPQPPQAPTITRRISLTRKQRVGLPVLAAVPLLAVLGVFGERQAEAHVSSRSVAMDVRYPERFRYRQAQSLEVTVRNVSGRAIDTLVVSLDTAYVSRFSSVRIDPSPQTAFVVALTGMRPGETRLVSAELSGDQYGRHRGRILAVAGADTAAVAVRTLVFP